MGTARLYYTDSYLSSFEAGIVRTSDDSTVVYLDESAFYPTSGGQAFDVGRIENIRVLEVRDEDEWVAHVLERPLGETKRVRGEVDWTRRYDNMQQHTGQHLLSAVMESLYGYATESVHMGEEISTIELATGQLSDDQVAAAEEQCADFISKALPVTVSFEDAKTAGGLRKASARTGDLRIVEIEGVDRSACGGTHVKSTLELGMVQIRRRERVRNNTRIEFVVGSRAFKRVRQDFRIVSELSRLYSVGIDSLQSTAASLRQRLVDADKERQRLAVELARREGADLLASTEPGQDGVRRALLRPPTLTDEARTTAQAFTAAGKAIALVLPTEAPAVLIASGSESGVNAGEVLKLVAAAHGGKGGGSATVAQGSLASADGRLDLEARLGF